VACFSYQRLSDFKFHSAAMTSPFSDWDDRFHQAAKDGNLDLLGKANRKDANTKDEDGMTPTNWAAYYGSLAALRKIIERG
jgi:ankyrin repeat protein